MPPLPLCRLLDALKIFDEVIPAVHDSVISYSCFIPILSIPYLFSLHDEEDYQLLRKSIIRESLPEQKRKSVCSRLRVALNWQGNIEAESPMATHRERSFQLSDLESVDSLRHVDLVCVQHGSAALQIQHSSLKDNLLGHGFYQGYFYDLACILWQCDILITNDTSAAHLGVLLGVKTWIALKKLSSWQLGYDHSTSLWYPSVKLFRRPRLFAWTSVMQELNDCLHQLL